MANGLNRFAAVALCLLPMLACAGLGLRNDDDPDAPKWQEEDVALPAFPQDKDLIEFYVGPQATNHAFVDASSLQVGNDGVVRYTLVIKTAGGAINITREGLHCDTREYRLYAVGRSDGTWVKSRSEEWRLVENKPINGYHAALSRDYFCPNGGPILTAERGREALRLGKNPHAGGTGGVRLPVDF
ncbi:MAG TPA: CNP1-like family protein [Rhodocyclaceae bacterium]|nr:CNP1-like family protein [Rhodocyclaceae bacterium]